MKWINPKQFDGRLRVLRIAHASLTPELRERERALAREYRDIDLEVLTTTHWQEAGVDIEATADDLFRVSAARPLCSRHIQLFSYDPRSLIEALRRHQPHLIDLNHEPYSIAGAEVLALRDWLMPSVPVVMQVAQNLDRHYPPPFNWLQRRALNKVAAAYACNEDARALLRSRGFRKPISLIPFGVNAEAFAVRPHHEPADGVLTIGFVGRMLPGKGLAVLAEALGLISSMKWRLLLVGDGPERSQFSAQLERHGLLDRARFTGAVPYHEVPELFREMDIFVMPTRTTERIREQFGRVLVEAMASGVPVIGTTCGAIPEVLADAGLVVPESDVPALAEAMRKLLSDDALRARLALLGRHRIEQHYSWELVARKTYELFQHVLRREPVNELARLEAAA
jgi:glycosyltransferase involved in cell wall biosynthesis